MGIVDHGIHMADIFCWLAGSDIDVVFGRGNYSGQPPSAEYVTMMFRNGAIGQLVYHEGTYPAVLPHEGIFSLGATWDVHGDLLPGGKWDPQPQCLYIHGEKGALRIFHYANKMFFLGQEIREEVSLLDIPNPGHFGLQMESFADSITHKRPPKVMGQDGLRALRIVLAAYESHEKKMLIKLSD
jgi:predicted dehydrogenase